MSIASIKRQDPDLTGMELADVRTLCGRLGIELRGAEGHPWHCGERMRTKVGVIGIDYAKCEQCGLTIGNMASPHINGGCVPTQEFLERGDTWARLESAP